MKDINIAMIVLAAISFFLLISYSLVLYLALNNDTDESIETNSSQYNYS